MPPNLVYSNKRKLFYLFACLLLMAWLSYTPAGLLGKADAVGYAVCHRFEFRSFYLGERAMPLCARCSGMFLGAVLGLGYFSVFSRRRAGYPRPSSWFVLGLFVLGFGLDGVNSFLSLFLTGSLAQINPELYRVLNAIVLYQPQNWLRLLTGTGMGLVMASVITPAFNQTVWQEADPRAVVPGLSSLAPLIGLGLLMDLAVLSENPLILYPLALTSAAGVLLLLTMIYTMVVLMLFKQENRFSSWRQLAFPITLGLCVSLLQVFLIDIARYSITHTWGGFPLP